MALEKSVLFQDPFAEFGKSVTLYCNVISKVKGDSLQGMILEKKGYSLPYIAILDEQGRLLAPHAGKNSVDGFKSTLEKAKEVQAHLAVLERRFKNGDLSSGADLLELRLDLRHFSPDEGRKRLANFAGLDQDRRALLTQYIDRASYAEIFGSYVSKTLSLEDAIARYDKLFATGARPASTEAGTFWYLMAEDAVSRKDLRIVELAIKRLEGLTFEDSELANNVKMAVQMLRQQIASGS